MASLLPVASSASRGPVIQRQPAQEATPDQQQDNAVAQAAVINDQIDDNGEAVDSIEAGGSPASNSGPDGTQPREDGGGVSIQTHPNASRPSRIPPTSPRAVLNQLGSGTPMAPQLRTSMDSFFGARFGGVQLHTDRRASALAASLGAIAFTVGDHIAFADGAYGPDTREGKRLIAHELTHVVQQQRGVSGDILRRGIGLPQDSYELEADRTAERYARHEATDSGAMPEEAHTGERRGNAPLTIQREVIQLFSGSAAAGYARKWALSTNTLYGRFSNDCTNFASQCMEAGGWTELVGTDYCSDYKKDSVWWFEKDGCWRPIISNVDASWTWGGAHNFWKFLQTSGRGSTVSNIMDLALGDVLQRDTDATGHVSHTMVVTNKTPTNLYLSYHTSDHLDRPLLPDGSDAGILAAKPIGQSNYYAWKIK